MFNNDVGKSTKKDEYIPYRVNTKPSTSDKSQVLVITGDSGSGKSVCSTFGLQWELRVKNYAFLFHSVRFKCWRQ